MKPKPLTPASRLYLIVAVLFTLKDIWFHLYLSALFYIAISFLVVLLVQYVSHFSKPTKIRTAFLFFLSVTGTVVLNRLIIPQGESVRTEIRKGIIQGATTDAFAALLPFEALPFLEEGILTVLALLI